MNIRGIVEDLPNVLSRRYLRENYVTDFKENSARAVGKLALRFAVDVAPYVAIIAAGYANLPNRDVGEFETPQAQEIALTQNEVPRLEKLLK